ncbi:hypothetical protein ACS0TY_027366 [Phlomoides rotata]
MRGDEERGKGPDVGGDSSENEAGTEGVMRGDEERGKGPDLTGIPCKHGICAILKQRLDPVDFVHEYYTIDTYLEAYEHPIYPISCEALWEESLYIPPLPPNFGRRTRRGKRQSKRRMGSDEVNNSKEGHNSKSCPQNSSKGTKSTTRKTIKGQSSNKSRSDTFSTNTDGVEISPPRQVHIDVQNEVDGIATQQSQVINEPWLGPDPVPQFQGPTMHQQLHMGTPSPQPSFQPRVQIRAPPPSAFGVGHFTIRSTKQAEAGRTVFVQGGKN